ncbi:MAG TPA: cytidylate kinase-like family protein [Clostridiaceae bacterium]|nr:cytidylate kinase-like family protein [Clostridiaceae bacterium]
MKLSITIGRQLGSGGRALGIKLAEALGIAYYDREIIEEIARRTSYDVAYIDHIIESDPIRTAMPLTIGRSFYPIVSMNEDSMYRTGEIFAEQSDLLKTLAERSSCVIVGRCASVILKDNVFRVFVGADEEARLKRCFEYQSEDEKDMSEKMMRRKMHEVDRGRRSYFEFHTGLKWGDPLNYDLYINTSNQDIGELAKALAVFVRTYYPDFSPCEEGFKGADCN